METEAFWAGSFGDEYLERNMVSLESRADFWRSAIEYCAPRTVLEVGCSRGHNLISIQSIDPSVEVEGIDINANAVNEARTHGITARVGSATEIASIFDHGTFDLVFTAGVLIHVAPDDLERVMKNIITTSARYVLAVEYDADVEEAIEYRGHADKLWKRPYGAIYRRLGLNLVSEGMAGGFKDCVYWLLEKPGARAISDEEIYR